MLRSTTRAAILALIGFVCAPVRVNVTVGEIARLQDTGGTTITGIGLVMGLNGSGDSGKDLALARQLLEYYKSNGNPLASVEEVKNAKTVAIVNVMCEIPAGGWKIDDRFDVTVSA